MSKIASLLGYIQRTFNELTKNLRRSYFANRQNMIISSLLKLKRFSTKTELT